MSQFKSGNSWAVFDDDDSDDEELPPVVPEKEVSRVIYTSEKHGDPPNVVFPDRRQVAILVQVELSGDDYEKFIQAGVAQRKKRDCQRAEDSMKRHSKGTEPVTFPPRRLVVADSLLRSMKEATKNMRVNLTTGEIDGHRTNEELHKMKLHTGRAETKRASRRRRKQNNKKREIVNNWIVGMAKP